jgi:AcrR family transcriptional regulator
MAASPRFNRLAPDERQAQILEAARRVFARTPYAAVSSIDIAREAGITRGLLHHYFGGKREVYMETIRALNAELAASIRTDRELPVEEMVAANAAAWLERIEDSRELLAAVLGSAEAGHDPEVGALLDETREAIVDRILINHTGTADHPDVVRLVIRSWLGLAETASREWLRHGRATRDQVRTLLVQSLLAMVRQALPALLAEEAGAT